MNTYQADGIPLEIAYMGNEIGKGVLFPVGKVTSGDYYNLAYLLHSCSSGIKASSIATKPAIAIHLSSGATVGDQTGWYDGVLAAGPFKSSDYDIQAVSYYPCWGTQATLAKFKSTISTMHSKYGKEIMVAETNWPQSCPDTTKYPFPSDTKSIPFSVSGQAEWIADLGSIVTAQTVGVGVTYWEGAWIDNAGLGTECTNMLLVDSSGKDLGGFSAIGKL
jgi:arabinogalactan endo-1,4-beta-galactosidase